MPPRHHALAVALVLVLGGCQAADPEPPGETVRPATPGPVATATEGATSSPSPTASAARGPRPAAAMADATSCAELAELVVDGLQDHVDAYATTSPEGISQVSVARAALLEELAASAGEAASRLGCAGSDYRDLLATELDRLEAVSGVQRAVAGTFVSGLLGGDDPSDPGPTTIQVSTADELEQAMIEAGSGSTIEVAAGTYEVDTSLVALRPLTVVGAGADDTTITSTATGAAIVIGVAGTVAITGVTITATAPGASVVAVTRGGLDLDAVTITGATRDDAGAGGFGLVLAPDGGTGTGRHAVTASTFRDNGGVAIVDDVSITGSAPGGIGVLEQAAPTIAGGTIDLDGEVAVLFGNTAGGTVDGTTITGARIGLQTSGGHDVRDVDCEIIDSTEPA